MSSFDEAPGTRRLIAIPVAVAAVTAAVIGAGFEKDSWQFYTLEGGSVLAGLAVLFLLFPQLSPRQHFANFLERVYAEDSLPRKLMEARDPRAGDGQSGD